MAKRRYRLTPIERMCSGSLSYLGPAVGEVLARLFELDASGPEELVTEAIIWWSDEDGGPIVKVNVDWRGEPDDGDAAIREPTGTVVRTLLDVGWRLSQLSRSRSDSRTCCGAHASQVQNARPAN